MNSVLLTAFEPYDRWTVNASWLTLIELTKQLPTTPHITTRLYPVDYSAAHELLLSDMAANYDVVIHLGQAPGRSRISLEAVALNIALQRDGSTRPLVANGPMAYASQLPLAEWSQLINLQGIPAEVSYHAGTYLCNAIFYYSSHAAQTLGLKTESFFLHVPLDLSQQVNEPDARTPGLPVEYTARALRLILAEIAAI